jgi:hypothetical protein
MSTKPDALLNLADAMAEDVLNTPDDEVLREVEEDFGDRRVLANKFDQILEHTKKQVFGTARLAAFSQVRSSVLDFPSSLPGETVRWVKGIFDLGSRLSGFLASLTPRTLAWAAPAAAVAILVPAAVITAVVVKEQDAPRGQSSRGISDQFASRERKTDALPRARAPGPDVAVQSEPAPVAMAATAAAPAAEVPSLAPMLKLNDEEIEALVARGRKLIVAGDIPSARLVLQQAADAGNATAALELGATYDPIELRKLDALDAIFAPPTIPVGTFGNIERKADGKIERKALPDSAMARTWYQRAKDLGSPEAADRLERLSRREDPAR